MKEWILYCVLCSLIYAMSTQAAPLTAELRGFDNHKIEVMDCAVFIPQMDAELGFGETAKFMSQLKSRGYSPFVTPTLSIQETTFQDSNGHDMHEYYTDIDGKKLVRNGYRSAYATVTGIKSDRLRKHKFTLRLHLIGQKKEVSKTIQIGTLGQSKFNYSDLPKCYSKIN